MHGTFDKAGFQFMYPENWELVEDSENEAELDVSSISPSGAFWAAQIFSRERDSSSLMSEAMESLKGEYPDLEATPQEMRIANHIGFGFDVHFFCLDFLVTGRLAAFDTDRHSVLIIYQAESREFESMEPVFAAITTSLMSSQPSNSQAEA